VKPLLFHSADRLVPRGDLCQYCFCPVPNAVAVWVSHLRRIGFGALLGIIDEDIVRLTL
jgi:hypothetical protein